MKYLKRYNEAISELQYIQRYTGGDRPSLTAEIKAEIDKIHSGCTREDIEDVFREIYDEGIGEVGKVDFYYGMDKQGERFYGFSRMTIEIIIDDVSKKDEYFRIRETAFDRIRDMYGYSPSLYCHHFRELNSNLPEDLEIGDKIDFNSVRVYWITPRTDESFTHKDITYEYEWALPISEVRKSLDTDLKNILLDASDLGYGAHTGWVKKPYVWIGTKPNNRMMKNDQHHDMISKLTGKLDSKFGSSGDLYKIIERVKSYLTSEGFKIEVDQLKNQIYIYFTK